MTSPNAADAPRQAIVRVPGRSRRARLEPVAGTDVSPESPVERDEPRAAAGGASGPNDERLKRERPPHW